MAPILVTAREAAAWTGRPVGTIWRWASEGRITRHGSGRDVRYNLRELHAWDEDGPGRAPDLPERSAA